MTKEWLPENPHKCTCKKGATTFNKEQKCSIWQEGGEAYLKTVVEWLEQPCTEHPLSYSAYDEDDCGIRKYKDALYHGQRVNCPECWQELKLSL